jgi:hypothetical protein
VTTLNDILNDGNGQSPKPAKQKPVKPDPGSSFATAIGATLALCAIVSGLAGVALHRGFGLSVPFLAGFFLVLGFAFFVRLIALTVAGAWFNVATDAAPRLILAEAVAEFEAGKVTDAMGFLDMDKKLREGGVK